MRLTEVQGYRPIESSPGRGHPIYFTEERLNWRRKSWLLAMICLLVPQLHGQDLQTKFIAIPRLAAKPTLADFEGMEPRSELARAMKKIEKFVQRNPTNG